mgnify:FL=1
MTELDELRQELRGYPEPAQPVWKTGETPYSWSIFNGYTEPLRKDSPWGIDVETDLDDKKPNETRDHLVGIGIACGDYCVYGEVGDEAWMEFLREEMPKHSFYAHNSKYDLAVLLRYGLKPGPLAGDGMLAAYLFGEPMAGLNGLVG